MTQKPTMNPKAARRRREELGLSRKEVSDETERAGTPVGEKAIYTFEQGRTRMSLERQRAVAAVLGTTVEALSRSPDDNAAGEQMLKDAGYHRMPVLLDAVAFQNLRRASYHYGVRPNELLGAAPWLFTLVVEDFLADRRARLAEAEAAAEAALAALPSHLAHGAWARSDFDEAFADEEASIAARDIFGKRILEARPDAEPFDPEESNPFIDFLKRKAREIGSPELDSRLMEHWPDSVPKWPVFEAWLERLTNGDHWARQAIEGGHVRLRDIQEELRGDDKAEERAAWLASKVPTEVRERKERRDADIKI